MTKVHGHADSAQKDTPDPLDVARSLIGHGIPVFTAAPNPNYLPDAPRTLNGKPNPAAREFLLPTGWQHLDPSERHLNGYTQGWALCLVTGHGLDAVDVDTKNGAHPGEEADRLETLGVEIVGTSHTPSGGAHLYVTSVGVCSAAKKSAGVDYRGRGIDGSGTGFLYLPGTTRPAYPGKSYTWQRVPDLDWAEELQPDEQRDAVVTYLLGRGITPQVRRNNAEAPEVGGEPVERDTLRPWLTALLTDLGPKWELADGTLSDDRSARFHNLVAACRRHGLTQGQTVTLMDPWCTGVGKFTGRAAAEVARSWGKVEPDPTRAQEANPPHLDSWDIPAQEHSEESPEPSSWEPVDLTAYLDGTHVSPVAELMPRTDGQGLFYPGHVHSVHGESESGKSLVLQAEVARLLQLSEPVLFLDFESDPASVTSRLLRLGATPESIREHFHYVRPQESPRAPVNVEAFRALLGSRFTLAVIDGVTDALGIWESNASTGDNDALSRFTRAFPRRLARETGAAVVLIDHVVKDSESRGRWAIGGQAKMAALDGAAYTVEVAEVCGLGLRGVVVLRIGKDRPGTVRPMCGTWRKSDRTQEAARVVIDSTDQHRTVVTVEPPRVIGPEATLGEFRPTALMERVSLTLEGLSEPLSGRQIEDRVTGKAAALRTAREVLEAEGYITTHPGPNRATLHTSVKPYRQEADPRSDHYLGTWDSPSSASGTHSTVETSDSGVKVSASASPSIGGGRTDALKHPPFSESRDALGRTGDALGNGEEQTEPLDLRTPRDPLLCVECGDPLDPFHVAAGNTTHPGCER